MSDRRGPIREIVIVGGGIVGWSAAAALRRRLPAVSITILPVAPPPDALADRISSTLPSIFGFHQDIGLTDIDTIFHAGSVLRLGTRFEGWSDGAPSYIHAYGPHGRSFGTAAFHLLWTRAKREGRVEPFDAYSPAAVMASAARVVPPGSDLGAEAAGIEPGLRLDPHHYREMMRAYALHLGTREARGAVIDVRLGSEDGFIEALQLDRGDEIRGDLFIDCTGPAASIRSRLDHTFEDWRQWLPCDHILFAEAPTQAEPSPLDRAAAMPAGWRWEAAGARLTSYGYVCASEHLSDAEAERALRAANPAASNFEAVPFRQGRRPEPWLRNCVAIGDAATSIEPLEWANLHLAHSAIDRIVSMMPDRDCSPVELWDYNRQAVTEADRVRDFLILHYLASDPLDHPFWRAVRSIEPPASLAHTLLQFQERGRLPFYEEETFSRDSWPAVLLGKQVIPRRIDPLADSVPAAQAEQAMTDLRKTIAATLPRLPTQGVYLNQMMKQAGR